MRFFKDSGKISICVLDRFKNLKLLKFLIDFGNELIEVSLKSQHSEISHIVKKHSRIDVILGL